MLVSRRFGSDPTVHLANQKFIAHAQHILRRHLDKRPLAAYPPSQVAPAVIGANLKPTLRRLRPDILHLHWIVDGFVRPEDFPTWQLPLVWTLHDSWAMTGGCHIPTSCLRFQDQCGACPKLNSENEEDITREVWRRKQRAWRDCDITVVGLSRWIAGRIRRSSLLGHYPIEVIPNAIDTTVFTPYPKLEARAKLGIPADDTVVLFGALDVVRNRQKGYHLLVDALKQLTHAKPSANLHLVVFGANSGTGDEQLPIRTTFLGSIRDNHRLAVIYSTADVLVSPSLVESLGNVGQEALACGTPVVAFEDTGLADVAEHEVCGYLAPYGDSSGIAAGIQYVLEDADRLDRLSQNARKRAVEHFSFANVAARYQALYASILERQHMGRA